MVDGRHHAVGRCQHGRILGHYEIHAVMLSGGGIEGIYLRAYARSGLGVADALQRQVHRRHDKILVLYRSNDFTEQTIYRSRVGHQPVGLGRSVEHQLGVGDGVAAEEYAKGRHRVVGRRLGVEDILIDYVVLPGQLAEFTVDSGKLFRNGRIEGRVELVFFLEALFFVGTVHKRHYGISYYSERQHRKYELQCRPKVVDYEMFIDAHWFLVFSVFLLSSPWWDGSRPFPSCASLSWPCTRLQAWTCP